jgi:site-specific recombinase XerD
MELDWNALHPQPQPPVHTLDDALAAYVNQRLVAPAFSPRTRVEYQRDLLAVVEFLCERCGLRRPSQVNREHLTAYLTAVDQHGWTGTTRRRTTAAIRSFFAFLHQQGVITYDPAVRLIPPERDTPPPHVLSTAAAERLHRMARGHPRDGALIALVLATGMRVSEAANLRLTDITAPAQLFDRRQTTVRIRPQGGRPERTVTLDDDTGRLLQAYLAGRPAAPTDTVFVSKFGTGLTTRAIRNIVAKHAAAAGLPPTSVSTLRHSCAVQQLQQGADPSAVQARLGHASRKTTRRYLPLARALQEETHAA